MSDAPTFVDLLKPYLTPGAIVFVGTVVALGHKIFPIAKAALEFIRGDDTKREKVLEREIDESKAELARLDKRREAELEGLREDLERKNEELAEARTESKALRLDSKREREERDFERSSGQRYYMIGAKAYQMLVKTRNDWSNGKPYPADDLPEFEDLVPTKRPDPPPYRRSTDR